MRSAPALAGGRAAGLAGVDLNALRALEALLDDASVATAALRLRITPAATSNALRRLREHFGDPLLVRRGPRLERTPLAERLREPVMEAMRAVARALTPEEVFDPRRAVGTLRVATSDHVDAVWLERLRRALASEAPGVTLSLTPYSAEAPARVLAGELELLVAPRRRFPETLRVARLVEEPYALALRAEHPRARGRLDLAHFAALAHVVVSPSGEAGETAVDRALAEHGCSRRVARLYTSFASALLAVAASDVVAVVPRSFAELHAARLGLRLRALPLEVAPARLELAWSPRLQHEPLHKFVRQRLLALPPSSPASSR